MPVETTTTLELEVLDTYPCTNVHLTTVKEQCKIDGQKNYLATRHAVVRDMKEWKKDMSQWFVLIKVLYR